MLITFSKTFILDQVLLYMLTSCGSFKPYSTFKHSRNKTAFYYKYSCLNYARVISDFS